MAFIITRTQNSQTYFLSNIIGTQRKWSTKRSRANIFAYSRGQMELFAEKRLADICGRYKIQEVSVINPGHHY